MHSLRVVRDVGMRLVHLVDKTMMGRVVHAYHLQLLVLPRTENDGGQQLAITVELPDGDVLVLETTLELLRHAVEELSPPGAH